MFLVTDTIEGRQKKVRSFLDKEPVIAVLLAAVDFEWTVRRAVVALGTNTNRHIRDTVLKSCHGADDYKKAWNTEVKPLLKKGLPEVVADWKFLKADAYLMRHRIVHGLDGMPSTKKASQSMEAFLAASKAIHEFAIVHGEQIFGKRLTVRRKPRACPA